MAEFEHEIRERVTRIESKLDQILDMTPLVNRHTEQITRVEESTKSAHKRLDELEKEIGSKMEDFQSMLDGFEDRFYKRAGIIAGAIGFIFFSLIDWGRSNEIHTKFISGSVWKLLHDRSSFFCWFFRFFNRKWLFDLSRPRLAKLRYFRHDYGWRWIGN